MSESNPPPPDPNPFDPTPPATQPEWTAPPPPPEPPPMTQPSSFDAAPPIDPGPFDAAPPPGAAAPASDSGSYDTAPASAPPPPLDTGAFAPRPVVPPEPLPYGGVMGYPGPYIGPPPDKDSKTMGMLAHLLGIFLGFIGPLIIWLLKKDTSPFVDDQGKESLNFQLVILIGYVISFATSFLCIGFLLFPLIWLFAVIFSIIATIQANNGVAYRYPVNIRFIK
jgi:uncharacterized Tic20 family protein